MGEYFYSIQRLALPEKNNEFGWQVMRHDGKTVEPASEVFLSSGEAFAEATRLADLQEGADF